MTANTKKNIIIEAVSLPIILFAVNMFLFPDNPGFSSLYGIPYLTAALFFAAYGGLLPGTITLALSALLIALPAPFLLRLLEGSAVQGYWNGLFEQTMVPLSVSLLLIYVFSMLHKGYTDSNRRLLAKLKTMGQTKHLLSNKAKALEQVNSELEERISRQQESITALYNQIKKIKAVSVSAVIEVLIETVRIFTKAEQLSVWRYSTVDNRLKLTGSEGWKSDESAFTEISSQDSIEGWVLRNNQFFSIRMLLQYENLRKIDQGRNILTIPIHFKTRIWGILNIEKMPFNKYNLYTEQLLFIIVSLIEPSLENAVEYESLIRKEEIDAVTGLPLFSSFYRMLEEELNRTSLEQGKLSVIIVELINYPELTREFSHEKTHLLLSSIAKAVQDSTQSQGQAFHYKEENQLAFIFSNLDYDGASLFCLEILGKMNAPDWVIDYTDVSLEVIVGYSSYAGDETAEEIIDKAENLLHMQKV
jgi:polysaccharide biosynthesis protein PelD